MEFVPEWRGRDEDGHESFEYIEGQVGNYPLPEFLKNITAVLTALRSLRCTVVARTDEAFVFSKNKHIERASIFRSVD